ncbi:MAG TPA: nuclear transport factor 2 family protein [Thermoleophilaceae bacterium]|nr:nuclear transport factor 2 family protein [Thermoleophilaceae bacterium]
MTHEETIDAYCAAWAEEDPDAREAQLRAVLRDDARYTDPRTDVAGPAELSGHIGAVLEARPGSSIRRDTGVEEHHGLARFAWSAVAADGEVLIEGLDVVEFSADGAITRIIGFFGRLESS